MTELLGHRVVDCSMPIEPHWRFAPTIEHATVMAAGGCRFHSTRLEMGAHAFTHVDAPWHVADDGARMSSVALADVTGEAAIADVSWLGDDAAIRAEHLATADVRAGDILLVRSDHASRWPTTTPEHWTRAPFMTRDAAAWVLDAGVTAIGFDFPQDRGIRAEHDAAWAPAADPVDDWPCHRILLAAGVLQIEYLQGLDRIPHGRCVFAAMPLRLTESDGAPVRAVAFVPLDDDRGT
ncbi:cyclase family protein [Agrococcus sp. SGAir0287]|uniref:cyclase family protein n=1 Tax=Agrococcus sp. SGAir0287 TaxID=2070347 RepID=UPI0010CD313F|nr:cyclase family protein [Agrococcus sp. SGAir0287]QCR19790.1 cyclase [Agrococcus sp. SGAir0287]